MGDAVGKKQPFEGVSFSDIFSPVPRMKNFTLGGRKSVVISVLQRYLS